jgi:hypothetical protein
MLVQPAKKDREAHPRRLPVFPRIFANALDGKAVSSQATAFSPGGAGTCCVASATGAGSGPATTIGA